MSNFLFGLGAALFVVVITAFDARAATEEPSFEIIDKVSAIEIREYGKRLAAEVIVDGQKEEVRSTGFRLLADFIFGNNTTRKSIAMTAPVAQGPAESESIAMTAPVSQTRDSTGKWRVRFFMPSQYSTETLPKPNNPAVQIIEVPGETMAVLRFSNSRSAEAVAEKTVELLKSLAGSKWLASGTPAAWFYDPPWTLPFFRRNEVAVLVRPT